MVCRQQGDRGLAIDFFQRSIGLWRQLGEPVSQANAEDNLAEVYLERHEWELARRVLARARERLSAFKPEGRVQRILSYINEHLRAAEEGEKQDRPSEI
jgi:tetratricopeptide (TPR) repeat protein